MDSDDFLSAARNAINLQAEDRWQAIEELVNHLVNTRKIQLQHRNSVVESIRKRELSMSTGIGFGLGIPHASTEWVSEPILIAGRSQKGIQFDALDGKPVRFVLLFLIPSGQFQTNCDTFANIAKLLHRQDFRDGLNGL